MEERIWVKIDRLRLHHIVPAKQDSKKEKTVWASLKLGDAFNIDGILINSKLGTEAEFTQGFGNANARLLDVPALHKKPVKRELLHDVLVKAIHGYCFQYVEVIRPFIENSIEGDELTCAFFKPEDWQGKSLQIPVDFIRLKNFQRVAYGAGVTADIEIGHHLIFWSVRIWDSSKDWHPLTGFHDAPCGEERIQEKELNSLINRMFLRPDVRETTISTAKRSIDMESKFIDKVKGCDPEATPPPIRFE